MVLVTDLPYINGSGEQNCSPLFVLFVCFGVVFAYVCFWANTSVRPNIVPQFLTLLLLLFIYFVVFLLRSFIAWKNQSARHTGWASHSLLGSEILRIFLVRRSFAACVCRSNLGNKRTRFTHSLHRMAHTLRHFCSYSSIGTDTRCCPNGAGFLFDITFCSRFFASRSNSLNDGTVKNRVKARFCSGVSEEMFKVR